MKVVFFETKVDGPEILGELILTDEGEGIGINAPEELYPMFDEILEETPNGINVEEDPEGWLEALAIDYSRGSMFYATLVDDEEPAETHDDAEAAKKAWQSRERAKGEEPKAKREGSGPDPAKVARAKKSYNAVNRAKHKIANDMEVKVASALGMAENRLPDNEPFDILKGKVAIEVKTIVGGKNDKITMHKASLERKVTQVAEQKLKAHTVAIDYREKPPKVYYRDGLGSFRLNSMRQMTFEDLKDAFK